MISNRLIAILLAALVIAGAGYTAGTLRTLRQWDAEKLSLATESAQTLASAVGRANQIAAAEAAHAELEDKSHAHQLQTIADLRAANQRLARDAGLRDPGARHRCPVSNDQSAAGLADADSAARLSDAAAGFLLGEAERADQIAARLNACIARLEWIAKNFGGKS